MTDEETLKEIEKEIYETPVIEPDRWLSIAETLISKLRDAWEEKATAFYYTKRVRALMAENEKWKAMFENPADFNVVKILKATIEKREQENTRLRGALVEIDDLIENRKAKIVIRAALEGK